MATIFSNQFFDTNGKRQRVSEDPRNKAAEVVRMRAVGDPQADEARKKFDAELIRAKVNIFLRNVDRHIKNAEIEEAERELRKAKELEPRNLYIHAFEERIAHIQRVHTQAPANTEAAQTLTPTPTPPPTVSTISPNGPLAREYEREKQANPANQPAPLPTKPVVAVEREGTELNREREVVQPKPEVVQPKSEVVQPKPTVNTPPPLRSRNEHKQVARSLTVPQSWRKRCLEAYKQCLMEIWTQGAMTSQESASLNALRERLEIDDSEHKNLERDVQWRIYINAMMEGCLFTLTGADKIERLREDFHIPAEAHLKMMKKTRQEILSLVNEYSIITNETGIITTQPQLQ